MAKNGVTVEVVRVIDHDIANGDLAGHGAPSTAIAALT